MLNQITHNSKRTNRYATVDQRKPSRHYKLQPVTNEDYMITQKFTRNNLPVFEQRFSRRDLSPNPATKIFTKDYQPVHHQSIKVDRGQMIPPTLNQTQRELLRRNAIEKKSITVLNPLRNGLNRELLDWQSNRDS